MSGSLARGRALPIAACVLVPVLLAACGSIDGPSRRIADAITPYKVEVIQGNFVSREQVAQLQKGMSREQVRGVLGTPLVASVFHASRWDYVFTLRRQGTEPQARRLSVYFDGEVLDRFEGDEMPSENEFVAQLETKRSFGKAPALEASEEALAKFPASKERPAAVPPPVTPAGANPGGSYPPIDPAR